MRFFNTMDKITSKWIRRLSQPNMVVKQNALGDRRFKPYAEPTRATRTTLPEEGRDNRKRPNWIIRRTMEYSTLMRLVKGGYLYGGDITELEKDNGTITRWWFPTDKLYIESETIQE